MTSLTQSTPAPAAHRATWRTAGSLSFGGVLRSERIKLFSLRSIRWAMAMMLAAGLGLSALLALAMRGSLTGEGAPSDPALLAEAGAGYVTQAATFGIMFTQLIMAVLGVLAVTNEYSTGMIRSSLTAVPRRTPVLLAKALLVFLVGLVIGLITTLGGAVIATLLEPGASLSLLLRGDVLASLLGGGVFLALVALFSLGIGAVLRSSAGAIASVVAVLFVAPIAMQIMGISGWEWVPVVAEALPSSLGQAITMSALSGSEGMGYWQALAAMVAWVIAALVPAAILLKTRDTV